MSYNSPSKYLIWPTGQPTSQRVAHFVYRSTHSQITLNTDPLTHQIRLAWAFKHHFCPLLGLTSGLQKSIKIICSVFLLGYNIWLGRFKKLLFLSCHTLANSRGPVAPCHRKFPRYLYTLSLRLEAINRWYHKYTIVLYHSTWVFLFFLFVMDRLSNSRLSLSIRHFIFSLVIGNSIILLVLRYSMVSQLELRITLSSLPIWVYNCIFSRFFGILLSILG